jgi:hypothetical protein
MESPGRDERPRTLQVRRLLQFRGGFLASVVVYATVVIIWFSGARLAGWRLGEFGKTFAWVTGLELLAGGVAALAGSPWRRFGAGLAVGAGLGLLVIIAVIAWLAYGVTHGKLTF